MIRATTGGVLKSYRTNLMNSFISMTKAQDTVLTQRVFNSYAEDPATAAKAFRLRKSRMAVESQYDICNDTFHKNETAFTCLDTISKLIDTENGTGMSTLSGTTLEMLNDPKGDARTQLITVLDQLSETIVQNLNQKYGDTFIFAGADGHNVPFEVKDNQLYYRGVPVDAAEPKLYGGGDFTNAIKVDVNGNVDPTGSHVLNLTGTTQMSVASYNSMTNDTADSDLPTILLNADGTPHTVDEDGNPDPNGTYYIVFKDAPSSHAMTQDEYDAAVEDAKKLQTLVNEKQFVDIGLGFQEDENGKLIESSAYNTALHGITFIGYGLDSDGDPKNIYSLVQRMREIAESVEDGTDWPTSVYDEFHGLVQKLEQAASNYKTEFTNMSAGTTKLKNNLALLEETHYNLQVQYSELEDVNMAEAITSFIWAQYCYNAALKVGNSILSESLMDYLS